MIKIDEKKFEEIKKWAFLMNCVPFLRGSFVCNSYAMGTFDEKSDIDLFVVTKRNRLYTARLFMNLLFRIFGIRTYGDDVAGKFCLSFFADEDNLNFTSIAKKKDFYFAYWIYTLKPIIDQKISDGISVSEKIVGRNFWAKDLLGFTDLENLDRQTTLNKGVLEEEGVFSVTDKQKLQLDLTFAKNRFFFSTIFRKIFEILSIVLAGAFFESILRKIQIGKIKKRLKKHSVVAENVVLKKGILKLHENDRRVIFRDAYIEKYGNKFNEDNFIALLESFRGK